MNRLRILGAILAALTSGDGVERGPDGAPTAFRIWKAGANPTDHGMHVFSARSAELLMAEQAARGNALSIDVDHMSLSTNAPPENHKAVGWHKLEVRSSAAGPELWACDVQWTEAVRPGLIANPPEWKFFSPAYDVTKETGEIVGYLNCALTNNPATWSVTALATSTSTTRGSTMNMQAIVAALSGDDDEQKKEARAALAAMNDLEKKAWKAYMKATFDGGDEEKPKDGEEKPAPKGEKEEETTAAAGDPPPPKDEEKATAAVAATAGLLKTIGEQDKRLAELEKIDADTKRAAILATRPDLTAKQKAFLVDKPPAEVQQLVDLIEKPVVDPAAAARVQATRGSHTGSEEVRASRLPPAEREELAERFGRSTEPTTICWGDGKKYGINDRVLPTMMSKKEALAVLARRGAKPALGRPPIASNLETGRNLDAQAAAAAGGGK
jgi:hypothetical protein